jgi:hypothetical protein
MASIMMCSIFLRALLGAEANNPTIRLSDRRSQSVVFDISLGSANAPTGLIDSKTI